MASFSDSLSKADLSKVTDIISADNSLRFCTEYLGIDLNKFKTIQCEAQFSHHDTLYKCLDIWRKKTEAQGKLAKDCLSKMLTKIQMEKGWFSQLDMAFLKCIEGLEIEKSSKLL